MPLFPCQCGFLGSPDGGTPGVSMPIDQDLFGCMWPLGGCSEELLACLMDTCPGLLQDDDGSP